MISWISGASSLDNGNSNIDLTSRSIEMNKSNSTYDNSANQSHYQPIIGIVFAPSYPLPRFLGWIRAFVVSELVVRHELYPMVVLKMHFICIGLHAHHTCSSLLLGCIIGWFGACCGDQRRGSFNLH